MNQFESMASQASSFFANVYDVYFNGAVHLQLPSFAISAGDSLVRLLSTDTAPIKIPHVDFSDHTFGIAFIAMMIPSLYWNAISLLEYYTRIPSRLCLHPIIAVYITGLVSALLSIIRSAIFIVAIRNQPILRSLDDPFFHAIGGLAATFGLIMILGELWQLGIRGTCLGEHFGFVTEKKITAFPFSVVDNPMSDGSAFLHLTLAIMEQSPAGILLSVWLFCSSRFASAVEKASSAGVCAVDREEKLQAPKTS